MTHRGASISNLGSVFAVVLLQAGFPALATAQPDYSMSNAKWKSSEQMVQSFTRSLRQQGRLTTPHNAIDLQGSQLFARNFWLEGATAMTVLKRLQSEHPLLSRLQVAPDEFVLSGQDENTHCMVSLKGVELLKQTVMISCATLSQRHAEAIFPHPALSVRWSWHEHLPAQSVYQQIIEIREKRENTPALIEAALREAGWEVASDGQSLTATQEGRHLVLSYLDDKRWNNAAYVIEIRSTEKPVSALSR